MSITIKQIAEIAGVHRSTVDKVLHKREGVSDEVRQHVQRIIHEVGYKPNLLGRALQKKQDKIRIGAVLLKVDALEVVQQGIESAKKDHESFDLDVEYRIVKYPDLQEQKNAIEYFVGEQVDGIILHPIPCEEIGQMINKAVDAGIPVVTLNYDVENSKRICFVGQNGQRAGQVAARLMGEFLNSSGEIAIITGTQGDEAGFSISNRENGFLHLIGKEFSDIKVVQTINTYDDPVIILKQTVNILKQFPELRGIYITGGGVTSVARALRVTGKQKDIKIICFEKYDEILHLLQEGIVNCTIDSDLYHQGYLPLQILMNLLVYDKEPETRHRFTDINILVKECIM